MAISENGSGRWRSVMEVVLGVIAAGPIGIFLYFMSILVWAEGIVLLAIPLALIPYVGPRIMDWLNFSRSVVPLIVAMAVCAEIWVCRVLIRRHHQVFAYVQAFLGLAVSLPFYYWTAVHQKPMLPFWGQ